MSTPSVSEPLPQPPTSSSGDSPGALLRSYQPDAGIYDEMVLPTGELRPHWKSFGHFLSQCTAKDLASRSDSIQRLLRDHGVTYNIYDDALGTSRPWALDLIPFIVEAQEWRQVQDALEQRGRLLNAILADLYGPQRLLHEGYLPPALVHANPGFLRPVFGANPPGGKFVFSMGCDLVRGPDGRWMVLADRTQAPSGQGYTLENRIILSNVFPEEFNVSHVQRLAAYYEMKRELLRSLAPRRQGDAGILMLTPGPYNETYFEHAFQARYLGFPLVEGADLTVRDRQIHLKTLEGLRRVDVMIRHVDDVYCDPLELQTDSLLGSPGLMEAWRSGNVALANGLGTGLIETPALHPFLPGLCRHLLGEELRMACVPTWWCGQKRELEMVLAEPDRWVVKPAFVRGSRNPVFMADLNAEQKAQMIDTIRAAPHEWVAQEVLPLSTTPTWTGTKLEPRSLVWRAFTLATSQGFATMPGGLTRVSPEPHRWLVTMRSGGISKDTWVVNDGPVDTQPTRFLQPSVIRPARPPSGVPSRAADHLFWLGRYLERLEQTVRLLRTVIQRLSGEQSRTENHELQGCLALMKEFKLHPKPESKTSLKDHLQALLSDSRLQGSVPDLMSRVRYNASAARDRLSDDMWRLINRIERDARLPAGAFVSSSAQGMLDTLILDLAAFSGMQQENMTRGHGWRFLEVGRRLERAYVILRLLHVGTKEARKNDTILGPLLEICDSTMTYRRLHFARPQLAPLLDLLLLNEINPRSVVHQITVLGRQALKLPRDPTSPLSGREKQHTDALHSDLLALNLQALAKDPEALLIHIPAACETLAEEVEKLSDLITENYFSHAARSDIGS